MQSLDGPIKLVDVGDDPESWIADLSTEHIHSDRQGRLHKCYHVCRNCLTSWQFWFGSVISQVLWFPFEHLLWERTPGFMWITHFIGL